MPTTSSTGTLVDGRPFCSESVAHESKSLVEMLYLRKIIYIRRILDDTMAASLREGTFIRMFFTWTMGIQTDVRPRKSLKQVNGKETEL